MRFLFLPALILFAACNGRSDAQQQRRTGDKFTAQQSSAPPLEFYTYGMPHFDYEYSEQRIAKRWGFSYRSIAGCEVTQELLDSARTHNAVVDAALVARHGADWQTRFKKEVAAAYVLDTLTRGIVYDNPTILATSAALDKQGKGLLIEPQGMNADGRSVDALAVEYDSWQGRVAYVVRYDLRVDTVARVATIVRSERRLHQYLDVD